MKNLAYLLALHSVNGLGSIRLRALVDYYQDPKLAWQANPKELFEIGIPKTAAAALVENRKNTSPEKFYETIQNSGLKILTIFDEVYPKFLKEIYDPPVVLYYLGELPENLNRSLGVVGTRKISGYGRLVTEKFAAALANAGVCVISGLARGVDTSAHQAAVKAQGKTVAVLGGGLRKIFPPENLSLAEKIASGFGAVISEFSPDEPSLPGNFPARNRIISGLSLGILVTEAAEDSGSLITAKLALEQGRDVFAVPGPITSEYSKGPSLLIKQGARLVTEPEEILEELGISRYQASPIKGQKEFKLTEIEQRIWDLLQGEEKHIDEICRNLCLASSQVSASLIKMEIQGLVKNIGGGNYTKSF